MRILILSHFFYPSITPRAFRTTELAKRLCNIGHSVTVCIPKSQFDYTSFLKEYVNIKIDFIDIPVAENKKVTEPANFIAPIFKRFINRIKYTYLQYPTIKYLKLIPSYLDKETKYDAIISIAVPHPIHWGIARAIRLLKKSVCKVWIADCGDPFMLCRTDTFRKPFYFRWFEKDFCRKADFITIPVDDGKKGYYPEFWSKIKVIPQGFDFSEIKLCEYKPNEVVSFAYAGGFIPGIRDPRPILDYLCEYKGNFRIYIYTRQQSLISSYKERLGDKLVISDYIERTELIYRLSSYDFLLNIENGTSVQSPSKLIDYALTQRPVLSLNSCNLDKGKFNRFLQRDYSGQMPMPDINDYSIVNVANAFIELIESKITE